MMKYNCIFKRRNSAGRCAPRHNIITWNFQWEPDKKLSKEPISNGRYGFIIKHSSNNSLCGIVTGDIDFAIKHLQENWDAALTNYQQEASNFTSTTLCQLSYSNSNWETSFHHAMPFASWTKKNYLPWLQHLPTPGIHILFTSINCHHAMNSVIVSHMFEVAYISYSDGRRSQHPKGRLQCVTVQNICCLIVHRSNRVCYIYFKISNREQGVPMPHFTPSTLLGAASATVGCVPFIYTEL